MRWLSDALMATFTAVASVTGLSAVALGVVTMWNRKAATAEITGTLIVIAGVLMLCLAALLWIGSMLGDAHHDIAEASRHAERSADMLTPDAT